MKNIPEIKKNQLPANIEEIHKFILIGNEVLKAHKAKIRALEKVESSYAAKEAALKDGQDMAEILLDAEAKLGKLLKKIPPKRDKQSSSNRTSLPSLPPGITKKESHKAQTIASNPKIIEQVKEKAEKEKRLPTSEEVYREVKIQEKKKDRDKKRKEAIKKTETIKDETIFVRGISVG
jgi:hypothetical protein